MAGFVCEVCGTTFSVPPSALERYPGWTPKRCRRCRTAGEAAVADPGPDTGVFTDGSAEGNPGPGGWGAVYVVDGTVVAEASGREDHTTNNRMELMAILRGLELVPRGTPAVLYSDSQYAVKTVTEWAAGWEARGWRRKAGPVENLTLVRELFAVAQARPEIEIRWIRGHAGARWNEYADALATGRSPV